MSTERVSIRTVDGTRRRVLLRDVEEIVSASSGAAITGIEDRDGGEVLHVVPMNLVARRTPVRRRS